MRFEIAADISGVPKSHAGVLWALIGVESHAKQEGGILEACRAHSDVPSHPQVWKGPVHLCVCIVCVFECVHVGVTCLSAMYGFLDLA